jgi:NarL family two-component system sensor histidine kinase YdfH
MSQRSSSDAKHVADDGMGMEWPFLVVLYVMMAGGYVSALFSDRSLCAPGRLALFTALVLVHGGLYWISTRRETPRRWWPVYFVVQVALNFAIGLLTRGHWLALGLYMGLVGQTTGALWPDLRGIGLAVFLSLALLTLNLIVSWGLEGLVQFLPIAGLMFAFVVIYVLLFVRQSQARERAQTLLRELETAHRKLQEYAAQVEELTISQERERMARELHDTLAQGLAGLILQLEAADSHLESGDPARAQAVVQQAMRRARTTLHEARRAIQALRPAMLEQGNLIDALGREIDQFSATTGVRTTFEVDGGPPDVSPEMAQDLLRIVQESLSNVARHAHAGHVLVRLAKVDGGLQMVVQDDGVGFEPQDGLERPGSFGLAGMQERAARLEGVLRVESAVGRGTRVVLNVEGGEG